MSQIKWTDNQNKVIDTRNKNILVSAGAGSGKTAVLVERIIKMITDKDNPIDIDQFLIVTFTRAAAAQMKEKIRDRLYAMSYKDPFNANIKRQISLIHTAKISTIDSFANQIVSEHFEELEIDPNFRVIEEEEDEMLLEDYIGVVLDDLYEEGSEDFLSAMEQFAEGKSTANVSEKIKTIIDKANNQVFPYTWLEKGKGKNHFASIKDFEKSELIGSVIKDFEKYKDFEEELLEGWKQTEEFGNDIIKECIGSDYKTLQELKSAKTYDEYREAVSNYEKVKYSGRNKYEGSEEAIEAHKKIVNYCSKIFKKYKYLPTLEEALEDTNRAQELADVLIDISIRAMKAIDKRKKYLNAYSFSDIAHFAIRVLCKETDDAIEPTDVATEMSEQFYEILIDEYQDSNYIQEYMLYSLTGGKDNMFMVGDVKQSIYRFRSAEPKLFLKKFDAFEEGGAKNEKILLGKNFRSRPEIIDATNFIFDDIMRKEVGGIDYAKESKLKCGAKDYNLDLNSGENDNKTELICVSSNDKRRHETEAHLIAKKILKLMDGDSGLNISDNSENARQLKYKDIVILTKAPATVVDDYISVLEDYGIPVFGEKKKGFYAATEVNAILDVMRVVDNPIQDIPLAAVLRNEVFDFSDDELAEIKKDYKYKKMYTALKEYSKSGANEELKNKVNNFLDTLADYREKSKYMSVYEFICYFLESTHYEHYVRSLRAGERKQMNIDMLKEVAYDYENTAYRSLFNFIRYIQKNIENDKDTGEAIEVTEEDDVVKIISIHKSKGLEYPVVFLANANFQRNTDEKDYFVDSDCNIGTFAYDTENKTKSQTFLSKLIKDNETLEQRAEELRLLYVAMTRAKEKLIVVSSVKNEINGNVLGKFKPNDEAKYVDNILSASNFHGYIAPVIGKDIFEELPDEYTNQDANEVFDQGVVRVTFIPEVENYGLSAKPQADDSAVNDKVDKDVVKKIKESFDDKYIYENELNLRSKMSVTEIKKRLNKEFVDEDATYFYPDRSTKGKPNFVAQDKKTKLSGAELGNIYHKIFELLDYSLDLKDEKVLENFLYKLVEDNKFAKEEMDEVEIDRVLAFTTCTLYDRMKTAFDKGELYRERKFLMQVDGEYTSLVQGIETKQSMIVQGIIDACFVENGKFVIVDYKTDNVDDVKELAKNYSNQVKVYKKAIEQISGIDVSETILYSVKLGEDIKV